MRSMGPHLRHSMLIVHILCSVGWIGAVAAYTALGVAAAVSADAETVRASWLAMELTGWWVIVPFGCSTLVTGLVMSLGTVWGLLQHYWVVIALVLTTIALTVLVLHMPVVSQTAAAMRTADDVTAAGAGGDVVHPTLGLVVLVVVAVLNVVKPKGMTPWGYRQRARLVRPARRRS